MPRKFDLGCRFLVINETKENLIMKLNEFKIETTPKKWNQLRIMNEIVVMVK